MNSDVYSRPQKPRQLVVKNRDRGGRVTPALPQSLPVLRLGKETQCFVTPSGVAAKMVDYLEATCEMLTLEPSAGTGQLIQALVDAGHSQQEITVIEKDVALWDYLRKRMMQQGVDVYGYNQCFIKYAAQAKGTIGFPRILMNPPFSSGSTQRHIQAAVSLLHPCGFDDAVLVALVPSTFTHPDAITLEDLPAGTFDSTNIRTKIIRIEG
jgi:phospholipid N-methyltransferase